MLFLSLASRLGTHPAPTQVGVEDLGIQCSAVRMNTSPPHGRSADADMERWYCIGSLCLQRPMIDGFDKASPRQSLIYRIHPLLARLQEQALLFQKSRLPCTGRCRVEEDGRLQLVARVANTKEMLWWLLGFCDGLEVCWRRLHCGARSKIWYRGWRLPT
jgi:hypothetical protein